MKTVSIIGIILALITISLSILAPITRTPILLGVAFVIGVIAFYFIVKDDDATESAKVSLLKCCLIIGGILIFLGCLILPITLTTTEKNVVTTEEYEIYHITAPFGEIVRTEEGKFSLLLFIGSGSFKSDVSEFYAVKYLVHTNDGDILRTMSFPALTTDLYITGKAVLEKTTTTIIQTNIYGDSPAQDVNISWRIEIPNLPDVDKLTGNYTIID